MFFLESTKINEIYSKNGPEFFREDSTQSFIAKNLKNAELVWVGNNRKMISLEKRNHTNAVNFMKEFLKKNLQVGIPKGLQGDFKRGFKISIGNKNLSKSIKEEAAELISARWHTPSFQLRNFRRTIFKRYRISKCNSRQIKSRINELEKLKIKSISLIGPTTLGNLAILGKGYTGVVVIAKKGNKEVALKIRRTDSPRKNMKNEAVLLKSVNSIKVGPKMIDVSKNFLVMEYLEGEKFSNWIEMLKGVGSVKELKSTIKSVLEDCYRLDQMGFDHGELSNISKHVIVGKTKSSLIDFESSSTKRRPSNVTSITQAFFIGSGISKKTQKIYKSSSKEKIIGALKSYKQEKSRENFEKLLKILKL